MRNLRTLISGIPEGAIQSLIGVAMLLLVLVAYHQKSKISPYHPEHTETNTAMDAALSEQFGQRLATLGVAAIVIDPVLSDDIWYSKSISANCRNRAFADDNDCYAQPMVAIDARGQRILRFNAYGTPTAEITVDQEGHVTARLRKGTTDLQTFDSALEAARAQIERHVALMEAEAARRASWEPHIEDASPNATATK